MCQHKPTVGGSFSSVRSCDTLGTERGWGGGGGQGGAALMDEVRPSSVVHRRLLASVNLKEFFFYFVVPGAAASTHASHIKMNNNAGKRGSDI